MSTYAYRRTSTGGSSFKAKNVDPCPSCGWRVKSTGKCEIPKGFYCKLLRCEW